MATFQMANNRVCFMPKSFVCSYLLYIGALHVLVRFTVICAINKQFLQFFKILKEQDNPNQRLSSKFNVITWKLEGEKINKVELQHIE